MNCVICGKPVTSPFGVLDCTDIVWYSHRGCYSPSLTRAVREKVLIDLVYEDAEPMGEDDEEPEEEELDD